MDWKLRLSYVVLVIGLCMMSSGVGMWYILRAV